MSVPASSFTPVPPSEYGWTPIPASKSPNAIIKVSRLTTPSFTAPKHCFVEQDDKEEKVIIPVWVFLLEKDGKAYFWDLGMMEVSASQGHERARWIGGIEKSPVR